MDEACSTYEVLHVHAIKAYGNSKSINRQHSISTLALDGDEGLTARSRHFTPQYEGRYTLKRGRVGTRAGLGVFGRVKNEFPLPKFEPQVFILQPSRDTNSALHTNNCSWETETETRRRLYIYIYIYKFILWLLLTLSLPHITWRALDCIKIFRL